MLSGATRHRLNWRKKLVLQVAEWQPTFGPGTRIGPHKIVWRDATFDDLMNLQSGKNVSAQPPRLFDIPPPGPKRPDRPGSDATHWDVVHSGTVAPGCIEYRFHGVTGEEES